MQKELIMVRYGELSTKGKNISDFINLLGKNIKRALKDFKNLTYQISRDHTYINLNGEDYEKIKSILKDVSGLTSFSLVYKCENDIEKMKEACLNLALEENKRTFKVKAKRAEKTFPMVSDEINRAIASHILKNSHYKVDVHNPEVLISLTIRRNETYIYLNEEKGAGGYPLGIGGKGMMMMSGGIDSPVAAYLGMKRGVSMEMVHFFSPPYTSPQALAKAKQLTERLAKYSGSIKFIQVPFAEIQETVKEKVPEGYLMTIQRRMMLRLAAALMIKRHGLAIFNGESLGQVASQTMESMLAINDVTSYPVLRPVLSFDKTEIIKIAQDIDTYDLSILPYEDCCTVFTPPSPKTRPNVERAREYEKRLDIEGLMQRALDGIEITEIHPGEDYLNQNEDVFAELL